MKVYVDEVPKNYTNCPCYDMDYGCYFGGKCFYDNEDCPLQSIQAHDKEVRKQVCDEIREAIEIKNKNEIRIIDELTKLLNKIEKVE